MTFLEWRKFNFFDLICDAGSERVSQCLKDKQVVDSSSGYGYLVFADSEGCIHLVNRNFKVTTLNAFVLKVCVVKQLQNAPLLVAIGEDEPGINPLIKIWNLEKLDKQGLPVCVRISRTLPSNRPVPASVICVHENLNLMAVGFNDGSIVLYRGEITRNRSSKPRVLREFGMQPVTGLAFKSTAKITYLFVVTSNSVFLYNVTNKDQETKVDLDLKYGCKKNCSTVAESQLDSHFMIGQDKAIYCYTPDGRGPCYAIQGEKVGLEWYRNYLVIVAKDAKATVRSSTAAPLTPTEGSSGVDGNAETHLVTVIDIQNKLMVFQAPIQDVMCVLSEWGSLFVLCGRSQFTLYHILEKDVQSKLALLFKKNLYDVAIRIAKSYQYDADGLTDIFRQYGDHLYSKGEYTGSIEQYIKTIGRLEPSYIIRKFLDSQHIEHLTTYLQALHKQGHGTEDHTTLLLNCYTKLDKTDKLKEFIMTKDREVDFDVEVAIKVCRQASSEDALLLAQKHNMHDWYLKIQIEDHARYKEALEYISKLEFSEAEINMKKYGSVLLLSAPEEATELLKRLCSDYRPSNKPLVDSNMLLGNLKPLADHAKPEHFIHLFTECPDRLEEFLEFLLQNTEWNALVYNSLLEHYLNTWGALESVGTVETSRRLHYEGCILRLLQRSDARYDREQVLILCQSNNFKPGILHLLEEGHLYQQILQYHMIHQDYKEVLSCCKRFGNQDPNLWIQALWYCTRDSNTPSELLEEILKVIEKGKSLPPLLVLDALCTSSDITLANVRSYLVNVLAAEKQLAQREQELVQKYRKESESIRQQIQDIQTKSMIFQISRCSACNHQLELPSVHFLCHHSFHQHCFQSFSENENECPSCLPKNENILDIIKSQENNRDLHETFHRQLNSAEDGFTLVAEYFGRGVFNKLTVVTDPPVQIPARRSAEGPFNKPIASNCGPGAEARIRLTEKPSTYRESSHSSGTSNASSLHGPVWSSSGRGGSQNSSAKQSAFPSSFHSSSTVSPQPTSVLGTSSKEISVIAAKPVAPSNPFEGPEEVHTKDAESKSDSRSKHRLGHRSEASAEVKLEPNVASSNSIAGAQTLKSDQKRLPPPSRKSFKPAEYDEAKNPFHGENADDEYDDSMNPFMKDERYSATQIDELDEFDKRTNPFAS